MKRFSWFTRFDNYLLKNHPGVWSIKLHLLLPWFFLGMFLTMALLYGQDPETYRRNQEEIILPWLYLIAACGLIVWLVYLFQFNPMKSFGNRQWWDEWRNFALIFLGVALLSSGLLLFYLARYQRVHHKFSQTEMISKLNDLNLGLALDTSEPAHFPRVIYRSDSNEWYNSFRSFDELAITDSIVLNKEDSSLLVWRFNYLSTHALRGPSRPENVGLLSGKEIFYALQRLRGHEDTMNIIRNFCVAARAFSGFDYDANAVYDLWSQGEFPNDRRNYYDDRDFPGDRFQREMRGLHAATEMNLYYWDVFRNADWKDIQRAMYYSAFFITLLILIFRNMTIKTYLVSVGVGVLFPLVVVLLAFAFNANGEDDIFSIITCCYIFLWLVHLWLRKNSRWAIFAGISLNLVTVVTPLAGIFVAAWYVWSYEHDIPYELRDHVWMDQVLFTGEIVGMLLFLILLQPLFKKLYVHWYSLPKE